MPAELIRKVLREATLHRLIVPVLCGSALDYIGIQPLLDAVMYLSAQSRRRAADRGTRSEEERSPDQSQAGSRRAVLRRWYSRFWPTSTATCTSCGFTPGGSRPNSRVYNPGKDKKENAAQLWHIQADRREQVPMAEAGDIVGIIGPRISITGDTLCDSAEPILLESIQFPETVISMAIEPETSLERKKLGDVLEMMKRQDPTFRATKTKRPAKRSSAAWANCTWK